MVNHQRPTSVSLLHATSLSLIAPRLPLSDTILSLDFAKIVENVHFTADILFIDKTTLSRNTIMNFNNNHIWSHKNPQAIVESRLFYLI